MKNKIIDIIKIPDDYRIICENENTDAEVQFEIKNSVLNLKLRAEKSLPKFVELHWNFEIPSGTRVLGDAWERSYADLGWKSLDAFHFMPWYFLAKSENTIRAFGVKTGGNSFVSFCCNPNGVTAWVDVRSGSYGVHLHSRELLAAQFVFKKYDDADAFESAKSFCRTMCDNPIFPKKPVYGGNNWYYAYGESSYAEILDDTRLQVRLAKGLDNPPFMVIDDCWQVNPCVGPWIPNKKFKDMKVLADDIKKLGATPGIWVRFLTDKDENLPESFFLDKEIFTLDPSRQEVLDYVSETVKRIKSWGYELIKHDFSTKDIFGDWGKDLNGTITKNDDLAFSDNTKTSAEIVLNFYKTIKEAAGETIVIGCNTISHLCAGLVELNRIGDDTSGRDWARTRNFGINTLAFRLAQHKAFYDVDADCVGILDNKIDWSLNSQWLDLLSKSGTPLFVSCPDGTLSAEQEDDLKKAYKKASVQSSVLEPLDWLNNNIPCVWKADGETIRYDWIEKEYPSVL